MIQKSFVLFKPDAMKSKVVRDCIYAMLEFENLNIVERKYIRLKPDAVTALWDFTLRDEVARMILQKYMRNQQLTFLNIEGEDAIEKVCKIKREIRTQYAKSFFLNCIHAPKNEEEYVKDINFLFNGVRGEIKQPLIYDTSSFSNFLKLEKEEFEQCADEIIHMTESDDFNFFAPVHSKNDDFYFLNLKNDNMHEMKYVVAALFDSMANLTLTQAYLICICVEIRGNTLIMSSNDKEKIESTYKSLYEAGLVVELSETI